MGMFSFLGEKKPDRTAFPSYKKSEYDAPSAKTIYDFYSTRAKGENLGFSEDQLGTMRGEAIDTSAQSTREMQRIAGQSRARGTGAVTTGAAQKLQERAVTQGLTLKSNALRDISLRNEILKKTEQAQSVAGLQSFLGQERQQANWLYQTQDLGQFQYDDKINQAISQWKTGQRQGWINAAEGGSEKAAMAAMMAFCYCAAEVYDGWNDDRTAYARIYMTHIASDELRDWYNAHSKLLASECSRNSMMKTIMKSFFDRFLDKAKAYVEENNIDIKPYKIKPEE